MKILTILPRTKATPVTDVRSIRKDAAAMRHLLDTYQPEGALKRQDATALALHHAQVCESGQPQNFFVVAKSIANSFGGARTIVNLTIIRGEKLHTLFEGCMSFPHRGAKKVRRFNTVVVSFQVPRFFGLFLSKRYFYLLGNLVAQVAQHEHEHAEGKNLYHKDH